MYSLQDLLRSPDRPVGVLLPKGSRALHHDGSECEQLFPGSIAFWEPDVHRQGAAPVATAASSVPPQSPVDLRIMAQPVRSSTPRVRHDHSHSMVAGGLLLMSYTTRLTPGTSFTIREEILPSTSYGSFAQSAVIPSSDVTALMATTLA
jgi:hypothetical protein